MTGKENALRIIKFNKPEYVMSGIPMHSIFYRGVNHQGYSEDTVAGDGMPVGSKWEDIWGTGWHKEQAGVMGLPYKYPLSEPSALSGYSWPNPDDERICAWIYEKAALQENSDTFLAGSHRDTLWEKAYMLTGMENMMMYFHTEPEFVREVLCNIMDFQLGIAKHYLNAGIEIANTGDDMGTQTGPLLGPDIVQNFLVPEYRRLFALYQKHNVLINFHSCGNVTWLIDTLIELGIDILNPVQVSANNLDELRKKTDRKLALAGGISSDLLQTGPVEKILEEVKKRILQLGKHGGYFCAPDQYIPRPDSHQKAYCDAVKEYGQYPLFNFV